MGAIPGQGRSHIPQGHQVPTPRMGLCSRARGPQLLKPVRSEPVSRNHGAGALQVLKPGHREPCATTAPRARRSPCSPQPESPHAATKTRSNPNTKNPQPAPTCIKDQVLHVTWRSPAFAPTSASKQPFPPDSSLTDTPWSPAQAREGSTCLRPLALAAPSPRHTLPAGVCVSQGPSPSGCRSNVPACPQRNGAPACPLQRCGEATSVGCSGRAGGNRAGEQGVWSRAPRQRARGRKEMVWLACREPRAGHGPLGAEETAPSLRAVWGQHQGPASVGGRQPENTYCPHWRFLQNAR